MSFRSKGTMTSSAIERSRRDARAGQIKSNIDAAREERELLRCRARDQATRKRWAALIRQWKQELKELTGEDY